MNAAYPPFGHRLRVGRIGAVILAALTATAALAQPKVAIWLTSEDMRHRLSPQTPLASPDAQAVTGQVEVDSNRAYQSILGLGSSLEPSTCWNLSLLSPTDREQAVASLVDPSTGIGMNLMRVCMGTPDFTGDPWYSYDDLPAGQTDLKLERFSIERDHRYILPVLKLARQKNPSLLFFASPWSPPGWMKTTGNMTGGQLRSEFYPVYAQYFVRFIRAYEAEGVPIHAVTIQNEPGVDRSLAKDPKWHYPSCRWTAEQERDFIRDHLGPAFREAGLRTEVWCYDHNYNIEPAGDDPGLSYPRTILSDPKAGSFVSGVAFHGYQGKPAGMTEFHREFPAAPLYFTEGSVFGIDGSVELVERLRNWARSYNAWVTILDERGKPNNGPFPATHAMIKFHSDTRQLEPLFEYYAYGHFMKFVQRDARRVHSSTAQADLAHVAFQNPDGSVVLVLVNPGRTVRRVQARWKDSRALVEMPSRSVATWTWSAPVSPQGLRLR